ncbi:MAG TPA: hypothetical protein DCS87_16335 [Rheinheimera sp.]|nr:hypothetical protein [Rheinheimera sp.]
MKTTLMSGFVLGMAMLLSAPLFASCDQESEQQAIKVIKTIDGSYSIENKRENKKCRIKNNLKMDADSSLFTVDFSAVDCSNGCKVILKRKGESEDAGKDDGDKKTKARVCKLNDKNEVTSCDIRANHLTDFCDNSLGGAADECHVRYVLKVGNQKVDPIIVVKPLPGGTE